MKFLALVLQPGEESIMHHCIDNWKHCEERIDTYVTPNTTIVELNDIADLVTKWAIALLTYDTCCDLAWFLSDTLLFVCHLNRFLI